jgi:hypothetical protein
VGLLSLPYVISFTYVLFPNWFIWIFSDHIIPS